MKTDAFLSIDLDYWQVTSGEKSLRDVLDIALCLDKINLYIEHDEIINDVNNSNARVLINIDYHDDYTMEDPLEAHCGNCITWKKTGKYIWVSPYNGVSVKKVKTSEWLDYNQYVRPVKVLKKYNLAGCSICISPFHYSSYCNCVYKIFPDIYIENKKKIICDESCEEVVMQMKNIYEEEKKYSRKRSLIA